MPRSHVPNRRPRLGLLAAALVGAACLAGVAAQDRTPPGGAAPPADLALVPPDALGFVHVHVSHLWQSEVGKNLRQRFAKELGPVQQEAEKALGLAVDDVDRATLLFLSPRDQAPLAVLTARKPVDRATILRALVPEPEEHQYKEKA